jgi:signal peptidase II
MHSAALAAGGRGTLRWWLIAAAVVLADHTTKWLASDLLASRPRVVMTPFFNFVLAHNTGAAFSFLAEGSGWQRWFFAAIAVIAVVLISMLIRRHAAERLFCAGLALILGGAIGNLIDRLAWGHVVDFLELHAGGWYWPAFNVADSAITVGAVLVILDSLRGKAHTSGRDGAA